MSLPKRIIVKGNDCEIVEILKIHRTCATCGHKGAYIMSDEPNGVALCIKHIKEEYKSFKRLEESTLAPEEKLVYDIMVQHGTTYKIIQQHTTKPLPGIRRVMSQLIIKGFVVKGSARGMFRIVVSDKLIICPSCQEGNHKGCETSPDVGIFCDCKDKEHIR